MSVNRLERSATALSADLSDTIRQRRRRLGMTQRELADFSTVSIRAIRDLENGTTSVPRPETVRLLTQALRIRLEQPRRSPRRWRQDAGRPGSEQRSQTSMARSGDVVAVRALMQSYGERVVSLTGAPGVGRSFLASRVREAAAAEGAVVLGVPCAAELSSSSPAYRLGMAVADALTSASQHRRPFSSLAAWLGDQTCLLVVDDPHRSVDLASLQLALRECPGLYVLLAGSPEDTPGVSHAVLPLPPPPQGLDSCQALAACSEAANMALGPHPGKLEMDSDPDAVAEICVRLDGLPFALKAVPDQLALYGAEILRTCVRADPWSIVRAHPARGVDVAGIEARFRALAHTCAAHERAVLDALCTYQSEAGIDQIALDVGLDLTLTGHAVARLVGVGLARPGGPGRYSVLNLTRHLMVGPPRVPTPPRPSTGALSLRRMP